MRDTSKLLAEWEKMINRQEGTIKLRGILFFRQKSLLPDVLQLLAVLLELKDSKQNMQYKYRTPPKI